MPDLWDTTGDMTDSPKVAQSRMRKTIGCLRYSFAQQSAETNTKTMTDESPVRLCEYCQSPISGDPVRYRGECYHRKHWQLAQPDKPD